MPKKINKEVSQIKKVPVGSLIDILLSLYKKGVDYVDIVHLIDEKKNSSIGLNFTEEYMKDNAHEWEDEPSTDVSLSQGKLTEGDLNDLL